MKLRNRLLQIGTVGFFGSIVIGFASWYSQQTYSDALSVSVRNGAALRNHMESDMMHDALRADVQRALWAASEKDVSVFDEIKKDVKQHGKNFRDRVQQNRALDLSADAKEVLARVEAPLNTYIKLAEDLVALSFSDLSAARAQLERFNDSFSELEETMADASDKLQEVAQSEAAITDASAALAGWIQLFVILFSGSASLLLSIRIANSIMNELGGEPSDAVDSARRISDGDYASHYSLSSASTDSLLGKMEMMREKLHANAEQFVENAMVRQALDQVTANVMIADQNANIFYLNRSVEAMMKNAEQDLRKELPNFDAAKLNGASMDVFHKNPAHQRQLINDLKSTYHGKAEVGERSFTVIATPVFEQGVRVGTVVEWADLTEQKARQAAEKLIQEAQARLSAENERVRSALDVADTSVMIADGDLKIIYMNKAVEKMMAEREGEIKKVLPSFSSSKLMGICVDDFHKNSSHQRSMLASLTKAYQADIKLATLTFGLTATPIFDKEGKRLGTVVEWDDKTERLAKQQQEEHAAAENARVKQALDQVTTNVMIADQDANIIYMNHAVEAMMKKAERDIQKALPNFDASKLKGANMDIFHKDATHQRRIIQGLKSTYHGKAEVGGRSFTVIASPVFEAGVRIGTVVEWADKTDEVAMEKEVGEMVEGASLGDFTRHINLDNKIGFFANLGKGLNELVVTVEVALNDIMRMLGAMAKGDLSERITRDYQGAFGQLKDDANLTADKLTEVLGKIRTSSSSILSAANEIAQGNADLSQRTEEQASSLEETASSMEEMTSTVKQSAENAMRANEVSKAAATKAKQGGEVVGNAVKAMEEINASSKKISDIIGVIDEIAFQTNLLALNAAVEAARAGEQGRGFAVVAGEVRNLAQRSAGAAKEIKELIRDSVNKVQDGRQLVNESGITLQDLVSAVENMSSMMQQIAEGAQEQTSGIEQVNTAVSQMDEMTQQNAALVEQASAAGAALAEQAHSMNSVVDFFNLGGKQGAELDSYSPSRGSSAKRQPARISTTSSKSVKKPTKVAPRAAKPDDEWEEF